MSNPQTDDPISGGLVRVLSGVNHRHVLMADGTWRLRSTLKAGDEIRRYGGGMLLGNGQIVPLETMYQSTGQ